jgi:hypothetical protein
VPPVQGQDVLGTAIARQNPSGAHRTTGMEVVRRLSDDLSTFSVDGTWIQDVADQASLSPAGAFVNGKPATLYAAARQQYRWCSPPTRR